MFLFWAIQARKMCFTIFQKEKTPFYAIKKRSLKSRKIEIFSKGLGHCFGPKFSIFPSFYFRQYRAGKCVLRYSRIKKTLLYATRTRISKSRKIESFPKGLVHGFDPKLAIFPSFHFSQQRAGKCVLRYSRTIKRLSRL